MKPSPISPTIDLDADGVQHGFLKLPYSRDESAWGALMIPITVVRRGAGPTALLTGANHGDEYEGPVALVKLANTLRAEDVRGCVIILPFMNFPAFLAARRTSPIDNGNMNRSFPGRPDGTVTEKIADYIQRHLLPKADFVLDIHAGGKTLDFVPFAAIHVLADKEQQGRCAAAMQAFNAPFSMQLLELDCQGMFDSAVEASGKVFVSTELGGGGTATARSVSIAEHGIRQFLIHCGICQGELSLIPSVRLDMPSDSCYVTSLHDGLLEMQVDLGAHIIQGDVVARIHPVSCTGEAAVEYKAKRSGLLVARHFPGLITIGDTLAVVADVLT